MNRPNDSLALFALANEPGFSWAQVRGLIEELGSPSAVLQARFGGMLFDNRVDEVLARASERIAVYEADGLHVTTLWSDDYPRQLRTAHDAPPVLYWQGRMDEHDPDAVAIVGTRNPDSHAREFTNELATRLAGNNTPVMSGLAKGIDAEAIRASLAAHGRTIGVIGTGHDRAYPTEHKALQAEVAAHLLLSQFPPGTEIGKRNFPMRNVVMSGCSAMSVIVQAGEHSGTRIQARVAARHGRPLILTQDVVNSTTWAKQMVEAELDITVVSSAEEAYEAVRSILDRDRLFAAEAESFLSL